MKKIIFLFLVLFSSILVVNADSTFYLGEKVTDMYVESINGSDKHNGAPFLIHRSDGKIVYCINPFKMISEEGLYKSYNYNDKIFNLTNEELNKLNIISYYGYGYNGHNDKKWYGITQYLMWKSLNFDEVYFTDSYYGNRIEKYKEEVNELEMLVSNYLKLPSFANNTYNYNTYTNYEIVDINNVLSNYEIKESDVEATIENNKLKLRTNGSGQFNITFIRKSPINRDYELYSLEGHQELLYPGKINDMTFSISMNVKGGSITVNRLDSENKERLEAELSGAVISLGVDNSWIKRGITDKNGSVTFSDLPPGVYTVELHSSSNGYIPKYESIYKIVINDTEEKTYNMYAEVIKGNLIINKYYGSENNYKLDESAIFEIYHNNVLIKTIKSENGIIKTELEYGTYIVKQINGKKYYDYADEFTVSINLTKDYKYNLYTEMEEELKIFFEEKENIFIERENELKKEQEEIKKEKENLLKMKEEIEIDYKLLNQKEININNKELELRDLEEKLNILSNNLKVENEELIELRKKIENKEIELNNLKQELDLFNNELKIKEEKIIKIQSDILIKEKEMENKKNKLKEIEEILVVEVPNTYKKNYKKIIAISLVSIGFIFIVCSTKKVTNH